MGVRDDRAKVLLEELWLDILFTTNSLFVSTFRIQHAPRKQSRNGTLRRDYIQIPSLVFVSTLNSFIIVIIINLYHHVITATYPDPL
jgi:hypothetical protein